jgi:3-oxoacyl-[acyl-carrier protein] reductase
MRLQGKIAIITGAATGIGAATAVLFAEEGAQVIGADIDVEGARRTVSRATQSGGSAAAYRMDLSSVRDISSFVERVLEKYGRIDVLVNNAGMFSTLSIPEMTEEDWDRVLDVNLKGTFFLSQKVIPGMIKNRYGKIVNVASLAGKRGGVTSGMNYASSKGGVIVITKGFAKFCAPFGINVNAVVPSFCDTPMFRSLPKEKQDKAAQSIPLGRVADPREVGHAILFLASDEASFITGEILDVDGGLLMD